MINKIIQALTLVLYFFNYVNATFQEIDLVLEKVELAGLGARSGAKNLSLVKIDEVGVDNQYAMVYINSSNKLFFATVDKDGIDNNADLLNDARNIESVNIIEVDTGKYLVSFAETGARCQGIFVDKAGAVQGAEVTFLATTSCTNVKATKIGVNSALVIMEVIDTDEDIKIVQLANGVVQTPASLTTQTTGYSVNPNIIQVGDNKILTLWSGAGLNEVEQADAGLPLNFQVVDNNGVDVVDGAGDAQDNVIVIGTQGNNYKHRDVVVVKKDLNSFTIAWNVQTVDENDASIITASDIWFATYNLYDADTNKVTNQCIENIQEGYLKDMATVLSEDLAYMIYTKDDGNLYGMEISATECYPDRDETLLLTAESANANPEFVSAKIVPPPQQVDGLTGSGIFKIVAMQKTDSSSSVHTVEYFHKQYSECPDNCVGCYTGVACPVCKGTSAEERMIRRVDDATCGCQDGYFNVDGQENCSRCQHQCETCTDENLCATCKNTDMLMPGCLYPSEGHYTYDFEGETRYGKCVSRCKNCETKPTNCTECQGFKRLNLDTPDANGYCPCETGFHDNYGLLKDCVQCPDYCLECYDDYRCSVCHPDLNRELNVFTGQCDCVRGHIAEDKTSKCVKGYMVSDGFIDACPKNTQQNEELQICEYLEYDLKSNLVLILVMGILIAIVQIALCNLVHCTLQKKYQAFASTFHEEQMKLKQQRDYIYKGLNEDGSSSNNGMSGIMGGLEDGSKTGLGSPNKRRRRGGNSSNLNQSNSLSSQQIQSMNSLVQDSHNHLRDDGDIKQLDDI